MSGGKINTFAISLLLFSLISSFCGCSPSGNSTGGKPAVVIWHWMTDRQAAFDELAKRYEQATGVKTIAPFHPTWIDHVYSCDYVYPGGAKMTLSVKEVSNTAETTAYFDSLATKLHKTKPIEGLGQGDYFFF